jgi:hypothetical protein
MNIKSFHAIIVLLLVINANSFSLKAQNPSLAWVKQTGSTDHDHGNSIAIDANGYIYTTGDFSNTVDFDPGNGISNLTSVEGLDIFVQKSDTSGQLIWAKQMGGTGDNSGNSITTDADGNVYITGIFSGTVDFDPGAETSELSTFGGRDIFIQKLDPNGELIWVKQIGGTSFDYAYSIALDAYANVFITGAFKGTADFDPGPGTVNLSSNGNDDIFIQKLDTDGNLIWAKAMGGSQNEGGKAITIDLNGFIYVTGYFYGTLDFDIGTETISLTSLGGADIFIQKLNTNGDILWVKQLGGADYDQGYSITTDASGNVYTTGDFEEIVDFDPGIETYNFECIGSRSAFIHKLDSEGNFQWVRQVGSIGICTASFITTDANGYVYSTGLFSETTVFDLGTDSLSFNANGSFNTFIQKLNPNGQVLWALQLEGSGLGTANSLVSDVLGNVYSIGNFTNSIDFDPGVGTLLLTTAGGNDIFIHKLNPSIVGISKNFKADQIVVYPNPSDGKCTIRFDEFQKSISTRLVSLTGQELKIKQFNNTKNIELELDQVAGIYLLEIENELGRKATIKIIKQ